MNKSMNNVADERNAAASEAVVKNLNDVVDLSKVKNIDAFKKADKVGAEQIQNKVRSISPHVQNKRKFCFMPPVSINLPSGGKFYQDSNDEDLKNGIIKMYPMSVADEEVLTNQAYLKNGTSVRILFESCMASDYEAGKLLSFDSTYLLYALRGISYGNDYTFSHKCSDCEKEFEQTIDISTVPWKELDDDAKEVYEIELPSSGYTVVMNVPRIKQDENSNRIKKQNDKITTQIASFISHTLSIKDTNGDEIAPSDWPQFFSELPGQDRAEITKTFSVFNNSPKVSLVCPECGNEEKVGIPMDLDFFRFSSK